MIKLAFPLLTVFTLAALGCEAPELSESATTASAPAPAAEPDVIMVAGVPGTALPPEDFPVTDVPRKVHTSDPVKGRRSRQARDEGYSLGVGTTAAAGLYAKHQMIYLSIDQANQLYWPQHDFKYPPTHEAYMKDVVAMALNGVPLPELAPGREYIYVPEMGDIGLLIRLTPGSPDSKLPKAEPGNEHIYDPKAVAAAGVTVPGLQADGSFDVDIAMSAAKAAASDDPVAPAADPAAATEPAAEEPAAEEPSPNIRERAAQIGGQADSRTQEALEGGP